MTIAALGFASFGVLGWLALRAIGRSYQRRGMSDQSLMVAAMWMLFAVTGSIGLVSRCRLGSDERRRRRSLFTDHHVGFRLLRTRRSAERARTSSCSVCLRSAGTASACTTSSRPRGGTSARSD